MPPAVVHWDKIEVFRPPAEVAPLAGAFRDLGEAAGTVDVGCQLIDVDPGARSSPVHREGGEEEIFQVLAGDGESWQDGHAYAVAAGDCLVHLVDAEAHTLIAGPRGCSVLAFGQRAVSGSTHLPRAGVVRIGETWVQDLGGPHPWEREAAAAELEPVEPEPRPARIVNLEQVAEQHVARGDIDRVRRDLGRAAGSVRTGLTHLTVAPGALAAPPHCHSAEEELFVILAGEGTLTLGESEHAVRAGSVVARPPGTAVAHCFRAGSQGLTLLAYGTREPGDVCFYPRSNKVGFRGIGLMARVQALDYWDGEE